MNGIGERLKELRKEKDLTLDELGSRLNMPKSSLSRYENNEADPSIEVVKKIAKFFNVSIDWITGMTDSRDIAAMDVDYEYMNMLIECRKNGIPAEHLMKFIELLKEGK